jgi:hypothetical protein
MEESAPRAFTGNEWFLQGPRWSKRDTRIAVKEALENAFASGYTGEKQMQICVAHNNFTVQFTKGAPFNKCERWMIDSVYDAVKKVVHHQA